MEETNNNEVNMFTQIQTFLDNVKILHEKEISWYEEEIKYLNGICNGQTEELQRAYSLLREYEDEIRRLKQYQEE